MCEVLTKVTCPHCQGTKVVKNGRKKDGTQNFLCKSCAKQFQQAYRYKGVNPKIKYLIVSMLLRNSGIRDIAMVLQVSRACVLNQLLQASEKCVITPKQQHYKSVQIDEFWLYVQHKKKHKRWLFYAYAPETNEVLGYVIGNGSAKTIKKLFQMLKDIEIEQYCTDNWAAFAEVLAGQNHQVGKHLTRHIEGVNNALRARNRRFVRKTTCFSKKDKYHEASIKILFQQ